MNKTFRIINRTSGADMGTWEGTDEMEALLAMIGEGDPGAEIADASDWIIEEA